MKIKIREEDKKKLEKYHIEYMKYLEMENTADNVNSLLYSIDMKMTQYRDKNDEPLEEWLELERIYDNIYEDN